VNPACLQHLQLPLLSLSLSVLTSALLLLHNLLALVLFVSCHLSYKHSMELYEPKARNLVDIRRNITLKRDLQDQEWVCVYMCMCAKDDVSKELHMPKSV